MDVTITALIVTVIFGLLYYYFKNINNYWKKRGIPQLNDSLPIVGDYLPVLTLRKSQGQYYKDIYEKTKDKPLVGFYELIKPTLLLNDPAMIEKILIKDFGNFMDHGIQTDNKTEVDLGLFSLEGPIWRAMRIKLIPAFTSGKLKNMFGQMTDCVKAFVEFIDKNLEKNDEIDAKAVITTYTMDTIASTAFGLDLSEMKSPDSKFRRMGQKIFQLSFFRYLQFLALTIFPKLSVKMGISFTPPDVADYFAGIIKDTFRQRKESNYKRNDFIQMLLALKDKGVIESNKKDRDTEDDYLSMGDSSQESNTESFELTDNLLISQAYTFLTAGFESMSSAILFVLYELAHNKELQEKTRQEVRTMIKKNNGLNYEALKDMTYLNNCINESFRLYPLIQFLFRVCNKQFTLDNGSKIEPGTRIIVPVYALHKDPQYHPDPDKFDPDRFTTSMIPCTYLPFGDGPRMCIGMRFAILEIKLATAVILNNYDMTLSDKTPFPMRFKEKSFITESKDPIILKLKKRSDKLEIFK